jgi:hypothetical protein
MNHRRFPLAAFTLIELVVAVGLIAALAGGLTLAFRREGNAGIALRSAATEIAAVARRAQEMATARQVPVRLLVNAEATGPAGPGGIRRQLSLACREGADWLRVGEAMLLPVGTCVVPPVPAAAQVRPGVSWSAGPLSDLGGPELVVGTDGTEFFVEFDPDGRVVGGPRRWVVGTAESRPGESPVLVDPAATRSVLIAVDGRVTEEEP